MTSQQNYINHIVMVLDMSGSMSPHARELIKVADGQIAHLARRSQELDQETRITVYVHRLVL
jgi:Mg-chelatase subunit ChlD